MNILKVIGEATKDIGYHAVYRDYEFADLLLPDAPMRSVPLAAFIQTPPSYRSAALAVIYKNQHDLHNLVAEYRALGAPLLFVVDGEDITVCQVRSEAPARTIAKVSAIHLKRLFEENKKSWSPDSILRAKSIGPIDSAYQLDFVDVGLLPAIELEVTVKLDRLLNDALFATTQAHGGQEIDKGTLFRVLFRLLAAKILQDRKHPLSEDWNSNDIISVLTGIGDYYKLDKIDLATHQQLPPAFDAAWSCLRGGINFSHISADDLAFVYENTLVTPEMRRHLGTHSTPRHVAEYVVQHLELWKHEPEILSIYEPFMGAGVFLVSALRQLNSMLPPEWDNRQRHNFFQNHISGDEVDSFACEVATLSLILADYPNENGWKIGEINLFENNNLADRMSQHNVILCNPPFESFKPDERQRYPIASQIHLKPAAILDMALNARPKAIGFVLPRAFILERKYSEQRRKIERTYKSVELVELPEGTFKESSVETALLIARDRKPKGDFGIVTLKSTEIARRDGTRFLKSGATTAQREIERLVNNPPSGDLWVPALKPLWDYLSEYPRLDERVEIHRGIEWNYPQEQAFSQEERPGYQLGLHSPRKLKQFLTGFPLWLDCRPEKLKWGAIDYPWRKPKIVTNAVRISRGPWRVSASVESKGLVCSQQFLGLWPKTSTIEAELHELTAVLNGPVANAYLAIYSPARDIRISKLRKVPVPAVLSPDLIDLVQEYLTLLNSDNLLDLQKDRLAGFLTRIDAAVLQAYDLPPRLERQLFDFFRDAKRPVAHPWKHWDVDYPTPGLRLAERLSGRFNATGNWIENVFQPLPDDEASLLRTYGE